MLSFSVVALCTLAVVVTSALSVHLHLDQVLPNFALLGTVYVAIHRDVFAALLAALWLGTLHGALLGEGRGLILLAFLAVIGLTRFMLIRVPLERNVVAAAWTVVAALVFEGIFGAFFGLLNPESRIFDAFMTNAPKAAVVSGVIALPFFALFSFIAPFVNARQERSRLVL